MSTLNKSPTNVLPTNGLPYLYGKWIGQLLEDSIPHEQVATCDACAMCFHEDNEQERLTFYFNPAVKCCTYIPEIPNFLLGAILASEDGDMAFGRSTVTQRITAGVGVTPLGLSPSPRYTLLYRNSPTAFGRSKTLGCPHYIKETGRCSIWQYRAPPCITWFCKHNRGAIGRDFWRELHLLLVLMQQNIALWCMEKLEIDIDVMRVVLNQPQTIDAEVNISENILDGDADEDWLRSVWGGWYGRWKEFYQHCTRLTEELDLSDIEALCGAEMRIRAQIVRAAHYKLLANDAPAQLRTGNFKIVNNSEDNVRVITYSPYDPLDIPKQILEALAYFNGRPLTEALDIITRQKNIPFNSKMLHTLLDFGVLIETHEGS